MRTAPRFTEADMSAYVFSTANHGVSKNKQRKARSKRTGGVGWQHRHDEVSASGAFAGRRTDGATCSLQL